MLRGEPLAVFDIRIAFTVDDGPFDQELITGTATLNPEQTAIDRYPDLAGTRTVAYLFKERQHTVKAPRRDVGDGNQTGADLAVMQQIMAGLMKSLDQARR